MEAHLLLLLVLLLHLHLFLLLFLLSLYQIALIRHLLHVTLSYLCFLFCSLAAAEEFELADALGGDLEELQEEMRSTNNRRKFLQGQSLGRNLGPGAEAVVILERAGIEECQVWDRTQLPLRPTAFPFPSIITPSNPLISPPASIPFPEHLFTSLPPMQFL